MTYFLLRDYDILPKKELHSSLWVATTKAGPEGTSLRYSGWSTRVKGVLNQALKSNPKPGSLNRSYIYTYIYNIYIYVYNICVYIYIFVYNIYIYMYII